MPVKDEVTVHWITAHEQGKIVTEAVVNLSTGGRYMIACQPSKPDTSGMQCTDLTFAVTCPMCQTHPLFRERFQPHPRVRADLVPKDLLDQLEQAAKDCGCVKG